MGMGQCVCKEQQDIMHKHEAHIHTVIQGQNQEMGTDIRKLEPLLNISLIELSEV